MIRRALADALSLAGTTLLWLADRVQVRHETTARILNGEDVR